MKFLSKIAQIYAQESDLQQYTFVFPNRRAGLFFRKELLNFSKQTAFAPNITDINSLLYALSELHKANDIQLLFLLYQSYVKIRSQHSDKIDSIDSFVPFGTTLLADFNEIDKYLIDVKQLFTNIADLKDLTDQSQNLSEQQQNALKTFWDKINTNEELQFKQDFISLWNDLYDIYVDFTTTLKKQNIAYDGLIHRTVIENLNTVNSLPYPHSTKICFIGFNHLTPTEFNILKHYQKLEIAKFYFDYPTFYASPSPLASSVAKYYNNQKLFTTLGYEQNTETPTPNITIHSTPSASNQINIAYSIINKIGNHDTESWAIILTDESLMLSLIEQIPENIKKINITMGNPLSITPIATLINQILNLQNQVTTIANQSLLQLYYKPILNILSHSHIQHSYPTSSSQLLTLINRNKQPRITTNKLQEFINQLDASDEEKQFFLHIFTPQTSAIDTLKYLQQTITYLEPKQVADTDSEFIHQYKQTINQLLTLIEKYNITLNINTLQLLLQRLSTSIKVQLKGEPIKGLQIMGPLESRLLDFDNLIILGFNDSKIPGAQIPNTIIPHNLRQAYNLPTHEITNAIQSYNFYRTLYHTKNLHLIYDSRNEGTQNEISRYYHQIKYLLKLPIKQINYTLPIQKNSTIQQPISIEKNQDVIDALQHYKTDKQLSVSRLKDYISCPLKFYFSSIARIGSADTINETGDVSLLGKVYHKTMELYYKKYKTPQKIEDNIINSLIKDAFEEETKNPNQETLGFNTLITNITFKFVKNTINFDIQRHKNDHFRDVISEKKIECKIEDIQFVGYIDRIDTTDTINIIDYKTTKPEKNESNIKLMDLFVSTNKSHHEIFQILFYCYAYQKLNNESSQTRPALYKTYGINKEEAKLHPIKISIPDQLYGLSAEELNKFDLNPEQLTYNNKHTIEIEKYDDIKVLFEWQLKRMLNEIFDTSVPFAPNPNDIKENACVYCNFKQICNKKN